MRRTFDKIWQLVHMIDDMIETSRLHLLLGLISFQDIFKAFVIIAELEGERSIFD